MEQKDIKIKIWELKTKQMRGEPQTLNELIMEEWPLDEGDIPLLLSPFKDVDGKELCEGDVISGWKNPKAKFIVKFGEYDNGREYEDRVWGCGWYVQGMEDGEVDDIYRFLHASKVFRTGKISGNIYENLELLED